MDLDGVDVRIIYPTLCNALFISVADTELLSSVYRTYNDWIAEFCTAAPRRLKAIAQLNMDDVQKGISELERCAKMGLIGAVTPVFPPGGGPTTGPSTNHSGPRPRTWESPSACTLAPTASAPAMNLTASSRN